MSKNKLDTTCILSAFTRPEWICHVLGAILISAQAAGAGDLNREIQTLQDSYQKSTGDAVIAKQLGRKLLEANKSAEAGKIFETLSERQPADAETHFLLGESVFRSGKYAEAAIELKRAYNLDPTKAAYAVRAGEALLAAKRYDELAELSNACLARNPDPAAKITLEWLSRCAQERSGGGTGNKLPRPKGQS